MRQRPDRAMIQEKWIQHVIDHPVKEGFIQQDGRIRRWASIAEMENDIYGSFCFLTGKPSITPSLTGDLPHEDQIF